MDQMAGTGPLHVFLTVCPLAQRETQTVLPKPTHVTLSCCLAPHAGMALHPIIVASQRWEEEGGPVLCLESS